MSIEIGDYVLATKYSDGDPMDHFCVGMVSGFLGDKVDRRILVVDNDGILFRANGFRRAEKITREEGDSLVALFPSIGNKRGPSLWWHLATIRGKENPSDSRNLPIPYVPADFENPDWQRLNKVHEWKRYISTNVREIWESFTTEQKAAIAANAEEIAGNEEWEQKV